MSSVSKDEMAKEPRPAVVGATVAAVLGAEVLGAEVQLSGVLMGVKPLLDSAAAELDDRLGVEEFILAL